MKYTTTTGIVLTRTAYGEADRIVTVLTPTEGKVRLMAKGTRKLKSKLAGGVELFSVSELTFLQGRGEIQTLTSGRLKKHFGAIAKNVDRTMFAYEVLKSIHKITEEHTEGAYFDLLQHTLELLDNSKVALPLIRSWFYAQLLAIGGYTPNLKTDYRGVALVAVERYTFSFDEMAFIPQKGDFVVNHIKLLRILFTDSTGKMLRQLENASSTKINEQIEPLLRSLCKQQELTA